MGFDNPFKPDKQNTIELSHSELEEKEDLKLKKEKLRIGIDNIIQAIQETLEENIDTPFSDSCSLIPPDANICDFKKNDADKKSLIELLKTLKEKLLLASSIALIDFNKESADDSQKFSLDMVDIKLPFRRRNFFGNVLQDDNITYLSIEFDCKENSFYYSEEPNLTEFAAPGAPTLKTVQKKDIEDYDKKAFEYYGTAIEGDTKNQIDFLRKDILSYEAAKTLYDALLARYIYILKQEQTAESEAVFALRMQEAFQLVAGYETSELDTLLEAAYGNNRNKQKARRYIEEHELFDYQDLCAKKRELEEKIADITLRRSKFHKLIEKFAHLQLYGKNSLEVKNDIFYRENSDKGKIFQLPDSPSYMLIEKDHTKNAETVKIFLGSGEAYTQSEDQKWIPAPEPKYESYINAKNNIQDDHKIAKQIIDQLKQEFPRLELSNNLQIHGSFHEQFQSFSIDIDSNSINQECAARGDIEIEILLRQIAEEVSNFLNQKRM